MKLSDFDYYLPKELIAQSPASPRDSSKLLVVSSRGEIIKHTRFFSLPDWLKPGDLLVFNDSKVFPARLFGQKVSGGKAEFLILKNLSENEWEVMIKSNHPVIGGKFLFPRKLQAEILAQSGEKSWRVRFNHQTDWVWRYLSQNGSVPLPPYIEPQRQPAIIKRQYQTVYSQVVGSAAAPTAGLHFTPRLLAKLAKRGIDSARVTLHVGLGTFEPVKTDAIEDFKIHHEAASITAATIAKIQRVKRAGGRIIAVGTTSTRVLEYVWRNGDPADKDWQGEIDLFVYPPYRFKIIDGLITNFHLPKSTLLMLLAALIGPDSVKNIYAAAIKHAYRFFSFGDAMLVLPEDKK